MVDLSRCLPVFKQKNDNNQSAIEWVVEIPPSLPYFDGHFPGQPVLPAVAIADINQFLIESEFTIEKSLKEIRKAKFQAPIFPNTKIYAKITALEAHHFFCEWMKMSVEGQQSNLSSMELLF